MGGLSLSPWPSCIGYFSPITSKKMFTDTQGRPLKLVWLQFQMSGNQTIPVYLVDVIIKQLVN